MRLNKYLAQATGLSRRAADVAIAEGRVQVNGQRPTAGHDVTSEDQVSLDGLKLELEPTTTTLLVNKPVGYVCSRDGQGSRTIYDLLPAEYHHLKPVGRLDKDSSGLLLMTDDGQLAYELTHPKFAKTKVYEVDLDKALAADDQESVAVGVSLEDGLSRLGLFPLDQDRRRWEVRMSQGRNRQIRRTFAALGYRVTGLRRIQFGPYALGEIPPGKFDLKQI